MLMFEMLFFSFRQSNQVQDCITAFSITRETIIFEHNETNSNQQHMLCSTVLLIVYVLIGKPPSLYTIFPFLFHFLPLGAVANGEQYRIPPLVHLTA